MWSVITFIFLLLTCYMKLSGAAVFSVMWVNWLCLVAGNEMSWSLLLTRSDFFMEGNWSGNVVSKWRRDSGNSIPFAENCLARRRYKICVIFWFHTHTFLSIIRSYCEIWKACLQSGFPFMGMFDPWWRPNSSDLVTQGYGLNVSWFTCS